MAWEAEVHNAKQCTHDGRDCFIASLEVDGKFPCHLDCVSESDTEEEAIAEALRMLAEHGHPEGKIRIHRRIG